MPLGGRHYGAVLLISSGDWTHPRDTNPRRRPVPRLPRCTWRSRSAERVGWSGSSARWARRSGCTPSVPVDVASLKGLLEQHRSRAEKALGQEGVETCVCCEVGYEGFWLARWLKQEMGMSVPDENSPIAE